MKGYSSVTYGRVSDQGPLNRVIVLTRPSTPYGPGLTGDRLYPVPSYPVNPYIPPHLDATVLGGAQATSARMLLYVVHSSAHRHGTGQDDQSSLHHHHVAMRHSGSKASQRTFTLSSAFANITCQICHFRSQPALLAVDNHQQQSDFAIASPSQLH